MLDATRYTAQTRSPSPDGITWLVVQFDPDTGGWFLFMHEERDEPCLFDSWHQTREGAVRQAESQYGIATADWRMEPG